MTIEYPIYIDNQKPDVIVELEASDTVYSVSAVIIKISGDTTTTVTKSIPFEFDSSNKQIKLKRVNFEDYINTTITITIKYKKSAADTASSSKSLEPTIVYRMVNINSYGEAVLNVHSGTGSAKIAIVDTGNSDNNIILFDSSIDKQHYQFTHTAPELGKKITYSINDEIAKPVRPLADDAILTGLDSGSAIKALKVRYNPKVTGLKYNYSDIVTPTLGSAYPYVTRNGAQRYKSFTIEGMISLNMDEAAAGEESRFWSIDAIDKAAALTDDELSTLDTYDINRIREREFRDKVIEFLHDGKTKLFRSVPEGSMLVRLTNVSLTGNEQLDRNIYTFSATATEVSEASVKNIKSLELGLIGPNEVKSNDE